jgi:hypothetical protein
VHPVDEDDFAHEPPPVVTWGRRAIELAKWTAHLLVVLTIIGIGEQLETLRRIDTGLAPYRSRLILIFGVLIATGFVMFMGGIIRFVLKGGQSGTLANTPFTVLAGVALAIISLCALGIAAGPPGLKLLVIVTAVYIAIRIAISTTRRSRRTPTGPR